MKPKEAVEMYLDTREPEISQATFYSHRSRLGHLLEWCNEQNIDDTRNIDARKYHEHRLWRRSADTRSPNTVTMKTYQDTVRMFARFLESIDEAPDGVAEKIISPSLSPGENQRDDTLDTDVADAILDHLDRFEHASRDHVVTLLIWHCLLRRGSVRAIDVNDVDFDEHIIDINHRPNSDTPLKNKKRGERAVAITPDVAEVLRHHVDSVRHDFTDAHGREPLVTTVHGRPHVTTFTSDAYAVTRPCTVNGGECPHGRDVGTCKAARDRQSAHGCPSTVGPHAIRRGAITHWLASDVPRRVVEDRADSEVLDEHYDARSERDKAEQRRRFLEYI